MSAQPETSRGALRGYTPPDFLDHGEPNCRNVDPEIFFPKPGQDTTSDRVRRARRICRQCELCAACGAWAITQTWGLAGIWGGTTDRQRAHIRRRNVAAPTRTGGSVRRVGPQHD